MKSKRDLNSFPCHPRILSLASLFLLVVGMALFGVGCAQDNLGHLNGYEYYNLQSIDLPTNSISPATELPASPSPLPPQSDEVIIDLSQVTGDGGFAYIIYSQQLPIPFDCFENNFISNLVVYENGQPLSQAHSLHSDIRNFGLGRYSHWGVLPDQGNSIRFSASDNSDPRTNGRRYTFRVMMP